MGRWVYIFPWYFFASSERNVAYVAPLIPPPSPPGTVYMGIEGCYNPPWSRLWMALCQEPILYQPQAPPTNSPVPPYIPCVQVLSLKRYKSRDRVSPTLGQGRLKHNLADY